MCVCGCQSSTQKTYALAPEFPFEIGVQQVHAARGFGDNSPTAPFLSEDVALTGRVHAKFPLPLLVISVAGQETMKNIAVTGGMDGCGEGECQMRAGCEQHDQNMFKYSPSVICLMFCETGVWGKG